MKRIIWICLCVGIVAYLSFMTGSYPKSTVQAPVKYVHDTRQIVEWAKEHLSQTGVLEEVDGFVYLKVDDGYIHQLFPLIESPRYMEAPYFRRRNSPGAHISVMYLDELRGNTTISELGERFSFELTDVVYVPPRYRNYIVLQVKAPALEAIRQKYGLSPLLKGHEFHITIAKKRY